MTRALYVAIILNVARYDEVLEELEDCMKRGGYDYYMSNNPYYPEEVVLLVNQINIYGSSDSIEDLLDRLDIEYDIAS